MTNADRLTNMTTTRPTDQEIAEMIRANALNIGSHRQTKEGRASVDNLLALATALSQPAPTFDERVRRAVERYNVQDYAPDVSPGLAYEIMAAALRAAGVDE